MTLPSAVIEVRDLIFAYARLDLHRQGTGAKPDDAIPRGSQTLHVHAIQSLNSHAQQHHVQHKECTEADFVTNLMGLDTHFLMGLDTHPGNHGGIVQVYFWRHDTPEFTSQE